MMYDGDVVIIIMLEYAYYVIHVLYFAFSLCYVNLSAYSPCSSCIIDLYDITMTYVLLHALCRVFNRIWKQQVENIYFNTSLI